MDEGGRENRKFAVGVFQLLVSVTRTERPVESINVTLAKSITTLRAPASSSSERAS